MSNTKSTLGLLFSLIFLGAYTLTAQTVTVTPKEYPNGLNNPFMGFRQGIFNAESGFGKWKVPEYNTIWRHYIPWSQIENNASDGVQKIIDYCNNSWNGCGSANARIIPRVYIDWDGNSGNEYWPADILAITGLAANDPALWRTQIVKDRIKNLISKLGEAWNNDPRVAWVQTGIVGYWGEQENPVGVDQEGYAQMMGDAFAAAFPNKRVVVRNQSVWDAVGHNFGVYWDSYGHPGQRNGAWKDIQNTNATGRYKSQIIEGEVAYDWGADVFDPMYGGEPELTLNKAQYTNNMIDVIRELHCTGLGWISSYMDINPENSSIVKIDSIKANASRMQNEFGYRFVLNEFSCSSNTEPDSNLVCSFKVTNTASAPFYYKWPVAVVIIDEATRHIKEKIIIPDIDITKWLPGDTYNYQSRTYGTPAVTHQVNASVKIPSGLAKGKYLVGISILEPISQSPGIFFAVENFFKESQTQPLARIGIGENADNNTLDGALFDDPQNDDARYYSITPGQTFSLTTSPAVNGSISIPNGPFPANSNIYVTAIPDSGYVFSSWGGDLTGSPNPGILAMDGNKNISVNFKPIGSKTDLFTNGNFSSGTLLGWGFNAISPSTAVGLVDEEEFSVDISNDDGQDWHISLMQYKISLIRGIRYTLKFKARAETDRTINTKVQLNQVPWTSIHDSSVSITTAMNSYSVTWVQTETNSNFKIGFFMGAKGNNNVWLDDVELLVEGPAAAYTLTSSTSNGSISINPPDSIYDAGTVVSLIAIPDAGYSFTGWSGDLSGANNPVTLLMDRNMNVTANFKLITHNVTVLATNGSVTMDPAGGVYLPGTVVNLTATPKAGYMFNGWSGDLTGLTNPVTITVIKNTSITANFKVFTYSLTTSATNGSVSLSPTGGAYNVGTQVTLTAIPNAGYVFSHWSGDLTGSANPVKITMDTIKNVTANFTLITYTLKTSAANGSILFNPDGGIYNSGTQVTLTAIPDSGYIFNVWGGDLSGDQNPEMLLMYRNLNITALFTQIVTSIDPYGALPEQTTLGQNYPNPFQTGTTIPYSISVASHVRLSIINCLGQHVVTLVDEFQNTGNYIVFWDAKNSEGKQLQNGLYTYFIETKNNIIRGSKLIICKY